ncbi:hypothetical protein EDB81DRAFT_668895 [Dactylonectria macrodidyma]|uniref:Uncharacterized protein n=1 Tax=Dactylonectria macrodidyma TaxID=307937 RepID=A0A9P9IDA7_9HYPO|nr:hypothetical protein EDB81DRAFT_668895 [Dactylonectria macrodidyma]
MTSPFEKTQISSAVTVSDAPAFFERHGIFYFADAAIARRAAELGIPALSEPSSLREFEMKDPRLEKILESYVPQFTYPFGGRTGPHFATALQSASDQANQATVYIFTNRTILEFFPESHIGYLAGSKASNGLYQVPYPFMKDIRKLNERVIEMDGGGVLMVHPRVVFGSSDGSFSMAYGCKRDAKDSSASQ